MIDTTKAKAWLKVEHTADDTLIGGLVDSAIAQVEGVVGRFLSSKAFTQELAGFPLGSSNAIKLFTGPVTGITSIFYDPSDGTSEVEITDYRLVEGVTATLEPAYGETWPTTLDGPGTVRIIGTAGYADGEAPALDTACLQLVAHWYQNREAVNVGNITSEIPFGVKALLKPYMPKGLA